MKKTIIIAIIIILIIAAIIFFIQKRRTIEPVDDTQVRTTNPPPANLPPLPSKNTSDTVGIEGVDVTYENNSFSPSLITISQGTNVRFVNRSTADIRISSNPHPTHTSYPDLESGRLAPGENYQIIFEEAMTVNYHNHFNPSATGKIIVKAVIFK